MSRLSRELEVALAAAREAAAAIRAIHTARDFSVIEKDGGRGPLTEADLRANALLEERLRGAFPDDGWLSEETRDTAERLGRSRCWIIDPLDGTREFTLGVPEFVVSVALVIDEQAELGVLVNPLTGEEMTGVVGGEVRYRPAADAQAASVATTTHAVLDGARLVVSRSETKKGWFEPWKDLATLEPVGSVAYKAGLVGVGRADATFTPKPRNEWDLAAGVAIVRAGGGRATDKHGVDYRFNQPDPLQDGVCVTNGELHATVLELMQQVG